MSTSFDFSSLEFVIQGVEKRSGYTNRLISSIESHYPEAGILIVKLEFDHDKIPKVERVSDRIRVVSWLDPGPIKVQPKNIQVNRQIQGNYIASKHIEREYVWKLRPELIFRDRSEEKIGQLVPFLNEGYVVSDLYTTKNFKLFRKYPFHISDWTYLVSKDTYMELFSIPNAGVANFTNRNLSPEGYVISQYLSNKHSIGVERLFNMSDKGYIDTLLDNFIFFYPNYLNLDSQHTPYKYPFGKNCIHGLRLHEYAVEFERNRNQKYPIKISKARNIARHFYYFWIKYPLLQTLLKLRDVFRR